MGRQPWSPRLTVEQCLRFSVTDLRRDRVFHSPPGSLWESKWEGLTGELLRLRYTIEEWPGCALAVRFDNRTNNGDIVQITTTRPHFGGRRFWFLCPLGQQGYTCRRRVAHLYLRPGDARLACRHCLNLTYRSCQSHDKRRDSLLRDPAALIAALQSKEHKRAMLGVRAAVALLTKMQ